MSSDRESKNPVESETAGKAGTTTAIHEAGTDQASPGKGNGQQGTGGVDGVRERTKSIQDGSQPHLGGADVSRSGSTPGTGLTENSDPMSRKGMPDLTAGDDTDAGAVNTDSEAEDKS